MSTNISTLENDSAKEQLNADDIILTDELCEVIGTKGLDAERIDRASLTFWADVWRRFKGNKLAIIGLIILAFVILLVFLGPVISNKDYTYMDYSVVNQRPSSTYWFGTDECGRDIFTRVCVGGQKSIIIGVTCTVVSFLIGSILGGGVDAFIMRLVEIIGSIPYLVLVVILSFMLGSSLPSLVFSLTLTSWIGTTRVVRGQILQIKSMDYIAAARALGSDTYRIIMRHLLPNTLGVIMVNLTLSVPGFIFSESFLSYIGLGIKPPDTSWGALCSLYQGQLMFNPYQLFFPSVLIVLTVLSFHLVGDGLADALDPKQRR